jgi:23S rRNA (cytosine1962-C5)-methyltransferase
MSALVHFTIRNGYTEWMMELHRVYYNQKYLPKVERGNPWIHRGELVGSLDHIEPGSLVEVFTPDGGFVGRGYINPSPAIAIRLLTRRRDEEIGKDFFRKKIEEANGLRKRIYPQLTSYRVVYGESDGLPGLVADRYGDVLVLSFTTAGMDRWRTTIINLVSELIAPRAIVLRNDTRLRLKEGLPLQKGVIAGQLPEEIVIQEHGLFYVVDVVEGRKTGFFFDQRENRGMVAHYTQGTTVLDCYTYTGAGALMAAAHGACRVWGVDNDTRAIRLAERNASLNGARNCTFIAMDMDQYFEHAAKTARRIQKAALRAKRAIRILTYGSQAPDHPILPALRKTAYLKCLFLRVD